jgi:transcriptional regulator with XRE-family HTH domain
VASVTDADEMRELLTYANLAKVGKALGVSRNTVSEWANGHNVSPMRVRQVRDLLRPPQPQGSALPVMVKRLLAGMMALERERGISDAALSQAMTDAEAMEQLALAADARLAERLAPSRRIRSEPSGGRAGGRSDVSLGSKRQERT